VTAGDVGTAAKGNNANNFDETMFTECGFMSFDNGGLCLSDGIQAPNSKAYGSCDGHLFERPGGTDDAASRRLPHGSRNLQPHGIK
jgi:hypothetical protein